MSVLDFLSSQAMTASKPNVLILGLGATGAAVARWMARGARLRIVDTRAQPAGLAALQASCAAFVPPVHPEYHLGCTTFDPALLEGVQQVVISPGLSLHHPALQALLTEAAARGVEVVGEIELFVRALADLAQTRQYQPQLLAITGTNGKTTVTALTHALVAASGRSVCAVGNFGPVALEALMTALENETLPQVWVLEVSSFQLATTTSLVPDAAVVLNVTQDHLDWHGTMHAYVEAKARLLRRARLAIVNRDDPRTLGMVQPMQNRNVISFGHDTPTWVGDLGLTLVQGKIWLATVDPSQSVENYAATMESLPPAATHAATMDSLPPADTHAATIDASQPIETYAPSRVKGCLVPLLPKEKLRLRGHHNVMNVLAALALGQAVGVARDIMLDMAQRYTGEPHRVMPIACIDKVDFIDDSKGTNVGATLAALEGLGQTVVLIVGGIGKNQDFSLLQSAVARHARAVIYIGQDGPHIARVLATTGVPCWPAQDLHVAVRQALALAQPGDAVLFSPACASMDMFRDYAHRAQVFGQEVQALALEKGAFA